MNYFILSCQSGIEFFKRFLELKNSFSNLKGTKRSKTEMVDAISWDETASELICLLE